MWAITGFLLGATAGWLIGEMTGGVSRARVSSYLGSRKRAAADPGADTSPRERIQLALDGDDELRDLGLTVVPAGRNAVELHGWVPSRRLRARTTRLAAVAAAPLRLVDCLLVRGEDDRPASDAGSAPTALQSA